MKTTFNSWLNEGVKLKPKATFILKNVWNKAANDIYKLTKPEKPTWDQVKKEYIKYVYANIQKGDYIKFTNFYSGSPSGKEEGVVHGISYGANNVTIHIQLEGKTEFLRWNTFTNDGYRDFVDYKIDMDSEVKVYEYIVTPTSPEDPYGEEEWE